MAQNRNNRPQNPAGVSTPVAMEVMRQAAEAGARASEPEEKSEESMPLFWRVFGGTVLSIVSLVVMTAYTGFTSSLAEAKSDLAALGQEVRKEVTRLGEIRAELIDKEDFTAKMRSAWRNLDELKADHTELVKLREQCQALVATFKAGEVQRRALDREVQSAREEQAADHERLTLIATVGKLRERLASLEAKATKAQAFEDTDDE